MAEETVQRKSQVAVRGGGVTEKTEEMEANRNRGIGRRKEGWWWGGREVD